MADVKAKTGTKKTSEVRTNALTKARSASSGRKSSGSSSKGTSRGTSKNSSKGTANGKTSTSNKNYNSSARRSSASKRQAEEDRSEYILEICFFSITLLLIYVIFANFGMGGKAGDVISGFFFGIFGIAQYVFPIYVIVSLLFIFANNGGKHVIRRVVWCGVILMIVSFIAQMIHGIDGVTAKSIYFDGYRQKAGGGVLFGGLLSLLYKPIGKVGTILVIILLSVISLIQVFNVSFISGIRRIVNFFTSFDFMGTFDKMKGSSEYDDLYDDDDDDEEYSSRRAAGKKSAKKKKRSSETYQENKKSFLKASKIFQDDEEDDDDESILAELDDEFDDGIDFEDRPEKKKADRKKNKKNAVVPEEEIHELHPVNRPDPFDDSEDEYLSLRESERERSKKQAEKKKELQNSREKEHRAATEEMKRQASASVFGSVELDDDDIDDDELDEIDLLFMEKEKEAKKNPPAPRRTEPSRSEVRRTYASQTEAASRDLAETISNARGVSYSQEVQEDYSEDVDPAEAIRDLQKPYDARGAKSGDGSTSAKNYDGSNGASAKGDTRSETKSAEKSKRHFDDEDVDMEETPDVAEELSAAAEEKPREYPFPTIDLLDPPKAFGGTNEVKVKETAIKLRDTLETFGVKVKITNYSCGPAVTRYEMQPEVGVKVNKILSLQDDIKLNLAAEDIRIEAPIPGKAAIGIEIPNQDKQIVSFRELIDTDAYERAKSKSLISFAVGKDIGGQIVIGDIAKMPHVLIAGQTGSGKSVCINTLIMSILYNAGPEDVRMIMIDPKMVELSVYNGIPHLLIPVVTDPMKAAGALNWAVEEMTRRYQDFQKYSVRNIQGFNQKVERAKETGEGSDDPRFKHMTQIVVIVDELADLMMTAHGEVEGAIVRLTQLARAAGIHLVIATQRPSVDVITGLIKANVPSRIACKVASGVDSRTILDQVGAEKLLGYGDMLFFPSGFAKPVRVQGAFLKDEEVERVTDYIRENWGTATYDDSVSTHINSVSQGGQNAAGAAGNGGAEQFDELFEDAARLVIDKDKASIGNLQRVFRIGFNRAARIMDQLETYGVVGPEEGTKPRQVIMTMDQFEENMGL